MVKLPTAILAVGKSPLTAGPVEYWRVIMPWMVSPAVSFADAGAKGPGAPMIVPVTVWPVATLLLKLAAPTKAPLATPRPLPATLMIT